MLGLNKTIDIEVKCPWMKMVAQEDMKKAD